MEVFLIAAVSADGKIAESADQNSTDWTSKEDLQFFVEKTKEAGAMIMGRKTFETIGKPLKHRLIIVMTRNPEDYENIEGSLEYMSGSPEQIIENLKSRGFDKIAIAGGAGVYSQFLQSGLVTDLYLTTEPVLFGQGVPLAENFDRINLELIETKKLGAGSVMNHYRVITPSSSPINGGE